MTNLSWYHPKVKYQPNLAAVKNANLHNNRLGITAKDDVLPIRLTTEPRPTGSAAGVLPDMELIMKDYYQLRRWDENGMPTPEALLPINFTPEKG